MSNDTQNRKKDLFLTIIIALVAIVDISLIFNDSVWGDEAYTMIMVKRSITDIVKVTATDVHRPLYYFISKIFTNIFGYSVPTVKLASITPLILTRVFIKVKSKKLFKEKTF